MNLIDKIIQEWEEHFKKGNKTLGTLPNDWKIELNALLEDAFTNGYESGYDEAQGDGPTYQTFDEYLKSKEDAGKI
ncbi:hypothetical protein [Romboutsia sp.]|uniref:hypothetical protein n=1 Tax=Romboutsia sp. TaxID=1965302 RepID=UPI003F3971C9